MKVINGVPEYKGTIDVMSRVVKKEGFGSLWKGFTPYYLRIGTPKRVYFKYCSRINMFSGS